MSPPTLDRPILSTALGLAVIVGLVLLAFVPNTGAIPADTSCTYGNCPTTESGPSTIWFVLLGAMVLVAAALGVLLLMRRRRAPSTPAAVEAWSGPTDGAAGPTDDMPGPTGPTAAAAATGAAVPAYLESPDDVGHAPPEVPGPEAAAPADSGGDIDSLMQELDKISGEILQRGKPKTTPPAEGEDEGSEK